MSTAVIKISNQLKILNLILLLFLEIVMKFLDLAPQICTSIPICHLHGELSKGSIDDPLDTPLQKCQIFIWLLILVMLSE